MTPEEQDWLYAGTENGPTVPNEEELLRQEFGEPAENGIYGALAEAQTLITPTGAEGTVKRAERDLGLGEPNYIQDWYRDRNGAAYAGNFAWCDAAVTKWAYDSGNHPAVCFGTDYAYTVAHASRFRSEGRWHVDIAGIRRGDIVFFDWSGSNSIAAIDHVGIVTKVDGGVVYTVEGNTSNRCLRRVRYASSIVGHGRPAYKAVSTWEEDKEKEDMPEYVSVGTHKAVDLPPGKWVTVNFEKEYSDSSHNHWDKGGPSLVVGSALYSLDVVLRLSGVDPDTELEARSYERKDSNGDVEAGPLEPYVAAGGNEDLHYTNAAGAVSKGSRVRFEVRQLGDKPARLTAGYAKALVWRMAR